MDVITAEKLNLLEIKIDEVNARLWVLMEKVVPEKIKELEKEEKEDKQ